jgi:hypothetical protein
MVGGRIGFFRQVSRDRLFVHSCILARVSDSVATSEPGTAEEVGLVEALRLPGRLGLRLRWEVLVVELEEVT